MTRTIVTQTDDNEYAVAYSPAWPLSSVVLASIAANPGITAGSAAGLLGIYYADTVFAIIDRQVSRGWIARAGYKLTITDKGIARLPRQATNGTIRTNRSNTRTGG